MAREEFRLMEAPKKWACRTVYMTQRCGKLCAAADETDALEIWVLEDYPNPRSWRLQWRINYPAGVVGGLIDARGFRVRFFAGTTVEVLPDGVNDGDDVGGEEILFMFGLFGGEEFVYNVRSAAWRRRRRILPSTGCRVMMHRQCILPHEVSFGDALLVPGARGIDGQYCYPIY
uniref:F-box associated domain-containing protein n=1 Tax=Leersia perrieri TaxID=77586 RepID=A0A0D9VUC6_9ORYZ